MATRSSALRIKSASSVDAEDAFGADTTEEVVFSVMLDEVWLATEGECTSSCSCEDTRFTNSLLDMHCEVLFGLKFVFSTFAWSFAIRWYISSLCIIFSNCITFIVSESASPNCLNSSRTKYSAGWWESSCSSWWCPPAWRFTRCTTSFRDDVSGE